MLSRKFISKRIVGPCGRKFRGTCEFPMGRRIDVEVSCVFSSGDNSTSKAQTPAWNPTNSNRNLIRFGSLVTYWARGLLWVRTLQNQGSPPSLWICNSESASWGSWPDWLESDLPGSASRFCHLATNTQNACAWFEAERANPQKKTPANPRKKRTGITMPWSCYQRFRRLCGLHRCNASTRLASTLPVSFSIRPPCPSPSLSIPASLSTTLSISLSYSLSLSLLSLSLSLLHAHSISCLLPPLPPILVSPSPSLLLVIPHQILSALLKNWLSVYWSLPFKNILKIQLCLAQERFSLVAQGFTFTLVLPPVKVGAVKEVCKRLAFSRSIFVGHGPEVLTLDTTQDPSNLNQNSTFKDFVICWR